MDELAAAMEPLLPGNVWGIVCQQKPLPDEYIVITPVAEQIEVYSGDEDEQASMQYRVSWRSRAGIRGKVEKMKAAARQAGFLIVDSPVPYYENETGFFVAHIEVMTTQPEE